MKYIIMSFRLDHTLQDIVYKLVPGLFKGKFYHSPKVFTPDRLDKSFGLMNSPMFLQTLMSKCLKDFTWNITLILIIFIVL